MNKKSRRSSLLLMQSLRFKLAFQYTPYAIATLKDGQMVALTKSQVKDLKQ